MNRKANAGELKVVVLALGLLLAAGAAAASDQLWLHVRVDEGDGAKVSVNLPISMVEHALPMIPSHHFHGGEVEFDDWRMEVEELRRLWAEIKASPDMTFVTVEDGSDKVRVWKEGDYLLVSVNEHGGDQVDVRIPATVIDALLSGEGDELDIRAALQALVDAGEGELVTVSGGNDRVRVWVDRFAEAE